MQNVEVLAREAAAGDREAFGELVRRLQAPVWRYAYHLTRSRDLADEAAQETWARTIRALPRFRGDSAVQTWLLAITRRVVAGLLHEQGRQPVVPEPRTPTFSTGLVEIQMALSALPQVLREVLVLTQVVGLSYQEASSVLGIKIGTVRSRVFRAREAMMVALCDRAEEGCVDDGL